jgi:hypothetical protein
MGPKPPRKKQGPKLSSLKSDIGDAQDEIEYLKSASYLIVLIIFADVLSHTRQRGIKEKGSGVCCKAEPVHDTQAQRTTRSQDRWIQPSGPVGT